VDSEQLRTFAAVIAEGSFDAAARSLRVTPSAVSQRMKALETSVGGVLVERGKPARPTGPGEVVLRLARQVAELEAEALRELAAGQAEAEFARIPLVVPGDALTTWVLPALAAVVAQRMCVEVQREDQNHSVVLLRQGAVLAAITADARPVQGCVVRPLGCMRYRPMASPEFARTWLPDGPTLANLGRAPMVVFDRRDDLQDRYLRQRTRKPVPAPRSYIPASADFVTAIRLGLGWGMVAEQQVESGVVPIDPSHFVDVPLYWQQWRLASRPLTTLADAITAAAAVHLRPYPAARPLRTSASGQR
jgi:LysR family transcriptional regulator (chromosome initiation inhibitor)